MRLYRGETNFDFTCLDLILWRRVQTVRNCVIVLVDIYHTTCLGVSLKCKICLVCEIWIKTKNTFVLIGGDHSLRPHCRESFVCEFFQSA